MHFRLTNPFFSRHFQRNYFKREWEFSGNYGIQYGEFQHPALGYAFSARINTQVCESLCKSLSKIMPLLILHDLRYIADVLMSAAVAYIVPILSQ